MVSFHIMNGGQVNRRGLTVKQQKFVNHYAETNGNGTEAAARAGYKPSSRDTLSVVAAQNLGKTKVAAEIERTMRKALSQNEVLSKLADIAEKSPEFKGSDTLKALELIGRFHKMFTDKVETSSPQDEQRARILSELAEKYHLTEKQAQDIVADVYGEQSDLASDSVS